MPGALLRAGHCGHGDWDRHRHRPLLQICEWGGQRGCGVPWVSLVGCPQGWCRPGGFGWSPFAGKQGGAGHGRGSLPAGRGCVSVGIISSGARCGQDLPCLAHCLPAPGSPCPCPFPCAGPLAPHALCSHRRHRLHPGELTAGVSRGCQAGNPLLRLPWSLPDTLCPPPVPCLRHPTCAGEQEEHAEPRGVHLRCPDHLH